MAGDVLVSAEPIIVEVTFRNPLKVSLALSSLSLLWRFSPDAPSPSEEETTTNEQNPALEVGNLSRSWFHVSMVHLYNSRLLFGRHR